MDPIAPVHAGMPDLETQIVVELPGERTFATVKAHGDDGTVVAQLTKPTMTQLGHAYRAGDILTLSPHEDVLRGRMWHPVTPRSKTGAMVSGKAGGMR